MGHWKSPILEVIESNPALFHVPLRQLYAHGRYPKPGVGPKAAAGTPRRQLGRLVLAAAAAETSKIR